MRLNKLCTIERVIMAPPSGPGRRGRPRPRPRPLGDWGFSRGGAGAGGTGSRGATTGHHPPKGREPSGQHLRCVVGLPGQHGWAGEALTPGAQGAARCWGGGHMVEENNAVANFQCMVFSKIIHGETKTLRGTTKNTPCEIVKPCALLSAKQASSQSQGSVSRCEGPQVPKPDGTSPGRGVRGFAKTPGSEGKARTPLLVTPD